MPIIAGIQFTYPGGIEGWVDLGGCLVKYRDSLPARRQLRIAVRTRPGVE